ncbi:MAG: flagellar protein FlgN [Candidatus Methylomirabilis sp.]|nr:flagellar protein FlgN [Deltaproteobacteria bacterium]
MATLEHLLSDQISLSEKLLATMSREKDAALRLDLEALREALFEKETLLGALSAMESTFIRHLRTQAARLGVPEDEATVTRLIEKIGGASAAALVRLRDKLRALHVSIQELNREERHLVEHSLRSIQLSLQIVGNRLRPCTLYSRTGAVNAVQGVRLYDRGA